MEKALHYVLPILNKTRDPDPTPVKEFGVYELT